MNTEFKLEENDNYMLVAMRRKSPNKGENVEYEKVVHRRLVSGKMESDLNKAAKDFAKMFENEPGVWRMYRSVNRRDVQKALKALQVDLVLNGEVFAHKVDSVWKSVLMKPENKAERLFLVDVDTKDLETLEAVKTKLHEAKVLLKEVVETPNGFHLVTTPFNKTMVTQFENVEVKTDALLFMFTFGDTE